MKIATSKTPSLTYHRQKSPHFTHYVPTRSNFKLHPTPKWTPKMDSATPKTPILTYHMSILLQNCPF